MKKMMKKAILIAVTGLMVVGTVMTSFAGSRADGVKGNWKKNHIGWWWQNEDGSWPSARWEWLDGNQDGVAECYYFDASGYMLANTVTPDGYQVNADGAWIENGVVATKQLNPYVSEVVVQNVGHKGGEITDGKSVEKLSFNNDFINYFITQNVSQSDLIKNATSTGNSLFQYTTTYKGKTVDMFVLEPYDRLTRVRSTVDVFFPGFPTDGMELDAFYENTGLRMQWRVGGSTGDLDACFELPQATYRFTEAQVFYEILNSKSTYSNIFILLTPGENGKWYIYPNNRVVIS